MQRHLREIRDKDIVSLRKKGWTLERIGNNYHLTRERVRQILAQEKLLTGYPDTALDNNLAVE